MTENEIQEYKYNKKSLLPCEREKLIKEHLEKAIALLDVEIVIQSMYSQMDYASLNTSNYKMAKEMLENTVKKVKI